MNELIQNIWQNYTDNTIDSARLLVKGKDIYLWDNNGKEYIDGISGLGVVNVGHGQQEIITAISDQLNLLAYNNPFMAFVNEPLLKLSEILDKIVPIKDPKFYFVNSGSEAVERAIMIAKQYFIRKGQSKKQNIISLDKSFHGSTFGGYSAGGLRNLYHFYEPLLPGFYNTETPCCYRCPYGLKKESCSSQCVKKLEDFVKYLRPQTIAAIIIEPVVNAGGIYVLPRRYVNKLKELCAANEILLIADEVVTGFGRVGEYFGSNYFNLTPDIITCAKGLSSGYSPIGCTIVSGKIADVFRDNKGIQNVYGTTFGANPVSCAAALKNTEILINNNLIEKTKSIGQYIESKIQKLMEISIVSDIRGLGCMWGIELVKDKETKERFSPKYKLSSLVESTAYRNGLVCRVAADVIRLYPPLIINETQVDRIIDILYNSIQDVECQIKAK